MRIEPAGMNPRHFANAWTGHPIVADFAEHDVCLWHHEQDRIIRPILPLVMHTRQMQQILATGQGDWGVDEYTRECLALEVGGGRFSGDRVADVLTDLFLIRGVPRGLRSDNGKEFVGRAVTGRLRAAGVEALAVEAGCPWENGVVESLNSILRDTLLNTEVHHPALLHEPARREIGRRKPRIAFVPDAFRGFGPHQSVGDAEVALQLQVRLL